ncbi:MAG: primosomal protein N' [Planctomycetes bacterium]|nr:primosomal protein N' [Planctomycetota bacterium]
MPEQQRFIAEPDRAEGDVADPHPQSPDPRLLADVALDVPGRDSYSYLVPDALAGDLAVGDCVLVPFGRRSERGFVCAIERRAPPAGVTLKTIASRRDDVRLPAGLLGLIRWGARYYRCSLGEFLAAAVPAPVRDGARMEVARTVEPIADFAGTLTKRQREVLAKLPAAATPFADVLRLAGTTAGTIERLAEAGALRIASTSGIQELRLAARDEDFPLTAEQQTAVDAVGEALAAGRHEPFLLYGVTGSGKTLVYLELARRTIAAGKQVLLLLPEIALTPQLAARVRRRIERVAVWHSGFTDGERAEQWRRVARGDVDLVVGTRSALFAPLPRPGLIIVDEEHEQSYKQESVPRYHARDLAMVYGGQIGAPVLLGSATPSLESVHNGRAGRYRVLTLRQRPLGGKLPTPIVIDMREECQAQHKRAEVSRELMTRLRAVRAAGEQAIVLLNRRGWSPVVSCQECGHTLMCPNCDISLTWHKGANRVRCHYCDHSTALPKRCPACQQEALSTFGLGTEQLAAVLAAEVPDLRVLRVDADTVGERQGHAKLFGAFAEGAADCLVGTQMVAKGLDFPRVTLVGIVCADRGLSVPDFRAAERTFQLIAQVSGRAGRGERPGTVVVQAFDVHALPLTAALEHTPRRFYDSELQLRREYGYPPFSGLVRILWSGPDAVKVQLAAEEHALALKAAAGDATILGPNPAGLSFLKGQHRWHALIKAPSRGAAQAFLGRLDQAGGLSAKHAVRVAIDVDPYQTT